MVHNVKAKPKPKGNGKGKGAEVLFDEKARAEYLTGFRKRKQERKQAGREYLAKKAKQEQLVARKQLREARKQRAAENVREQRKAFGLDAEGESDRDNAHGSGDEQADGQDVAHIQEDEYDSEEHLTHVVVEAFDPEHEAFEKATAAAGCVSSASKPKANGQGEEASDPYKEQDVSQKRLLVSGLTASFSQEDLVRRFSTFGTVVSLDGLGKHDALGQLRPYAYLTLQASPQQIQRCINVLSGSVWKGGTLRIGEAKPDYQERIELEKQKRKQQEQQQEQQQANHAKKRKRLAPGMGYECCNMEPVDRDAVESGLVGGWKRTPAGHLVRPLRMRPSHPLPRPSRASTLSRMNTDAEHDEQQQQSSRRTRLNPRPPTKAHRITIDPTRYGAIHVCGALLESSATQTNAWTTSLDVSSLAPGEWHCEEIQDVEEEGDDEKRGRMVRWQYIGKHGMVLHEEFSALAVRVARTPSVVSGDVDDVMAQLDFDRRSEPDSDDGLFCGFGSCVSRSKTLMEPMRGIASEPTPASVEGVVDTADMDELFANLRTHSTATTNAHDLFSELCTTVAPANRVQVEGADVGVGRRREGTTKGRFVAGLDADEEEAANFSDGYDETVAVVAVGDAVGDAQQERKNTLALLGEMIGSCSDDESRPNHGGEAAWVSSWSSESEDQVMADVEAWTDTCTAVDAKTRRAMLVSSASHASSYTPIARFDGATLRTRSASTTAPPAMESCGTKVWISTLKQMFQPATTTSFSPLVQNKPNDGFWLMDSIGLEFELESVVDSTPTSPTSPTSPTLHAWRASPASIHSINPQPSRDESKKPAGFFPCASRHSTRGWNGSDARGGVETWLKPRTSEERNADWTRYKHQLTQVVKKRHREAARKQRRRFGLQTDARTS